MNRSSLITMVALAAVSLIALLLGAEMRAHYAPEWLPVLQAGEAPAPHPWAVEADCYSQLARVDRILKGQGLIQNHFAVENWPDGLVPSTTAPFDYAILMLYAPLKFFTQYPLDWAGALISPALWFVLVLFWWLARLREFNKVGRAILILGSALLPALIWATAFGRPRHQSLILVLMAMGLTAEYERWLPVVQARRCWSVFAGIIWGLACWTSLFEPLFVVVVIVGFNLILRRRESGAFGISFGVVMLVALLVEGVHIFVPPPEYQDALARWLVHIQEVQPMRPMEVVYWLTLGSLLLPYVAWRLWTGEEKTDRLLVILTIALVALTVMIRRWVPYASLGELLLLTRYTQLVPIRWTRSIVSFVFMVGILYVNDMQMAAAPGKAPNQPSAEIATLATAIDKPGGIMAPWWISPGLLYFSGQPIVSGSSHCGISGIVASANFYASRNWLQAEQILRQRQVRWIVVWDEPTFVFPLLQSSEEILGQPLTTDENKDDAASTTAQILISDRYVPPDFHLRAVTRHLMLYEYAPGR